MKKKKLKKYIEKYLREYLRKPEVVNIAVVSIDNLREIAAAFGDDAAKDADETVHGCIADVFGRNGKYHKITEGEYICFVQSDIRGYVSQLKDSIGFAAEGKNYPLAVTIEHNMT